MRIEKVELVDASHQLPMPDRGGRLFDAGRGERVDVEAPFWHSLLVQGAIRIVPAGKNERPATEAKAPRPR